MAVGPCKAMSQVSWCFPFVSRNSTSSFRTFRPQRESQIAREHSLYFSSTTICSYDPFIKHLVSVFFSVFAQMWDGTELPSLDGSWCVVVEMSKLEIKDGVWLSSALLNWEVEHGLSEEMTFKQRKPSVKVESKFCGDLEKSFKSRRNSKYEVAMVDACCIPAEAVSQQTQRKMSTGGQESSWANNYTGLWKSWPELWVLF